MLTTVFKRGILGLNAKFLGFVIAFGSSLHKSENLKLALLRRIDFSFSSCANRRSKHDSNPFLPGGGLEKLQGGIQEEKYFNLNDFKLILKMREQSMRGSKPKDDVCTSDWGEYKTTPYDVYREHSCMSKHKNCMEELFFYSQEAENLRILEQKMRQGLDSFEVGRSSSPFSANITSTDLQKIPPLK